MDRLHEAYQSFGLTLTPRRQSPTWGFPSFVQEGAGDDEPGVTRYLARARISDQVFQALRQASRAGAQDPTATPASDADLDLKSGNAGHLLLRLRRATGGAVAEEGRVGRAADSSAYQVKALARKKVTTSRALHGYNLQLNKQFRAMKKAVHDVKKVAHQARTRAHARPEDVIGAARRLIMQSQSFGDTMVGMLRTMQDLNAVSREAGRAEEGGTAEASPLAGTPAGTGAVADLASLQQTSRSGSEVATFMSDWTRQTVFAGLATFDDAVGAIRGALSVTRQGDAPRQGREVPVHAEELSLDKLADQGLRIRELLVSVQRGE